MFTLQGMIQSGAVKVAEEVFDHLDEKLAPRVFLIGIPDTEGSEPVCLEPADECGYKPEFFSGLMQLAEQLDEEEAARAPFGRLSTEGGQTDQVSGKSIQNAVQKTLKESDEATGVVSYCSLPTTVGSYKVCCVLQLDAKAYWSHFSLPVERGTSTRYTRSLINSTAIEFLKVCAKVLRDTRAEINFDIPLGREPEEILRMGGRELMLEVAQSGAFDALNKLSWKMHEGELAGGEMLIVHWDDPSIDILVDFKDAAELHDTGAARKILEMAKKRKPIEPGDKGLYLVSWGDSIVGIGRLNEPADEFERQEFNSFIIKFTGYYKWEMRHKEGGVMMVVINGVPSLPNDPFDEDKFKDLVCRIFLTSPPEVDKLCSIVRNASDKKKGTMIVISSAVEDEAERLGNQSTLLKEPVPLTKENLLMLSSIDGALLVNPAGMCPAVGVILDGTAVKRKGTRVRGARYNSAIRYICSAEEKKIECLAIVISEDGMINLVPDLNKRIYRSEITGHMKKLREAVATEVVNTKEYYKAINWLSAHRFYLSESLGIEINDIKNSTRPRLNKQEGYSMTPADFAADDEMNDSYFLDEPEAMAGQLASAEEQTI
jgi:hypothetical protein